MEIDVAMSDVGTKILMASYVEDNTSQGKDWIFNFYSAVHVCSPKEMFNSLIAKEEESVKMMNGSTYEVIDTGTVNFTCKDGTTHALEVVMYILKVCYNLIS